MYVAVFQWLPYKSDQYQITRIFPNKFDSNNFIKSKVTIPSSKAKQKYNLRIDWTANKESSVDEFLAIVGTREKIPFLAKYSYTNLKKRLTELPLNDQRVIRKAYRVVRGE